MLEGICFPPCKHCPIEGRLNYKDYLKVKKLALIMLFGFGIPYVQGATVCDSGDTATFADYSKVIRVFNIFCSIVLDQVEKATLEQEKFDSEAASSIDLLNHITKDISDLHRNFDDAKTFLDLIPDYIEFSSDTVIAQLFLLRMRFAVCQLKQDRALWQALQRNIPFDGTVVFPRLDISQQQEFLARPTISIRDMKYFWGDAERDGTLPSFGWSEEVVVKWRLSVWKKVSQSNLLSPHASLIIKQRITECDQILAYLQMSPRAIDTLTLMARRLLHNE